MLSFQTTYAIQILDLLCRSEHGMSISELHTCFFRLPTRTVVTDVVRLLKKGGVIRQVSDYDRRLRLAVPLGDLTLYDLILVMNDEDKIGLGKPVCFARWYLGYDETHSCIRAVEEHLEAEVSKITQAIIVADLINDKAATETLFDRQQGGATTPSVGRGFSLAACREV